ncbi:hypothetical protein KKF38_02190 [Patescibacteria group bacterium]|nr:hypothetical protein [Patescibacteria group bacterium]
MLKSKVKLATNMADFNKFREAPSPKFGSDERKKINRVFAETPLRKLRQLAKESNLNKLLDFLIRADLDLLKIEAIPRGMRGGLLEKCGERMKTTGKLLKESDVSSFDIKFSPENLPLREKGLVRRFNKCFAVLNFLAGKNALEAVKYSRSPKEPR